ncbi:MAG: hypothetical protein KIT72_05185 [Polyangiaceae bacterium]|nr:hypothetical protein [Polyangiaceae bacterium]MCW5789798.1 hypothetical protein [Polyangiaceae bacterium]
MVQAKFDPALALKFDLDRGTVSQAGAGARVILPVEVLAKLIEATNAEATRDAGHHLGAELGRRVLTSLGDDASGAAPEAVLEHLGGELALLGFGSLHFERWGQALVFVVQDGALPPAADDFVAAIFDGALLRLFGKNTRAVRLAREDGQARYLISSSSAADRVAGWLSAGVPWGEALTRLQGARA